MSEMARGCVWLTFAELAESLGLPDDVLITSVEVANGRRHIEVTFTGPNMPRGPDGMQPYIFALGKVA